MIRHLAHSLLHCGYRFVTNGRQPCYLAGKENISLTHLCFPHGDESRLDILPVLFFLLFLRWVKHKLGPKQKLHSIQRGEPTSTNGLLHMAPERI
jgi:hypothetical protein